jgi:hypothetical protein
MMVNIARHEKGNRDPKRGVWSDLASGVLW